MDAFDTSSFDMKRGAFPVGDAQPVAGYSLWNNYYATLDWFKAVSRLPFI